MNGTSKWIDIAADDGNFGAYLALPRSGSGPGIVLIQEIFGVNAHIRSVADQYAADGYVVLAPDLFWRSGARIELGYEKEDWDRAVALKQANGPDKARADLAHAAKALRALPGVSGQIASIGYCYGGLLSYFMAADGLVDTAIAYYGGGIQNALDCADRIKVPLLMHFGGKDQHITADMVSAIAQRFEDNEQAEIHVYPQADHGFNCSHRAAYNQRAAAEAHGHSLVFLSETL